MYGERVRVTGEAPGWMRVMLPSGSQGWVNSGALTTRTIVWSPGGGNVQQTASSREIALAGKGFNEQVEIQFREGNPKLDFTWVDRMETLTVTPEQVRAFLEEGGLLPRGGEL
jgi:hypothetical protein